MHKVIIGLAYIYCTRIVTYAIEHMIYICTCAYAYRAVLKKTHLLCSIIIIHTLNNLYVY